MKQDQLRKERLDQIDQEESLYYELIMDELYIKGGSYE